jgi:hypothetical protein
MRFLLGVIVGFLLTVGAAFVVDSFEASEVASDATSRQIVNWDVAKERLHDTTGSIRLGWHRLKQGINHLS